MNHPKREVFKISTKAGWSLLIFCSLLVLGMFGYCGVVVMRGIENDVLFFNLVELLPLGAMVTVFWFSLLFRPAKKRRR